MLKKLFLFIFLFGLVTAVYAQTADPGPPMPPWDIFMDYMKNGEFTFTYKTLTSPTITGPTFTGTLTLANDETITNTPDGTVTITANDDGSTLLTFTLFSSNDSSKVADNDKIVLNFSAYDDTLGATNYATIEGVATDVSDESEDGRINFKVMLAGTAVETLHLIGYDTYLNGELYLENGEIFKNDTDSKIQAIFDDDAATLGIFQIESSNAQANVANSDALYLNFLTNDNAGNGVVWAQLTAQIDDVVNSSKDSRLVFKTYDTNGQVSPLTLIGNDALFADDVEGNGNWTFENDEVLGNAVDGAVSLTFNDNAAILGAVNIASSDSIADNDAFDLNFNGLDESANVVTWATYEEVITDATANSKDSKILFKTWDTNSFVTPLSLIGNDATFADDITSGGIITLKNGENIDNDMADGQIWINYDDDAVGLGVLALNSNNAYANMSDNDYLEIQFIANDDSGGTTDFADIQGRFTDVSDESEDGEIQLWAMTAGSNVNIAKFNGTNIDFPLSTITMKNDEVWDNTTDGTVGLTFDEDAATLGTFNIASSVDSPAVADNDLFLVNFQANDDTSTITNFVQLEAKITDVTDETEDSQLSLKVLGAGASKTPLMVNANGLTVQNAVSAGTASFDNGVALDTVKVVGVTSSSIVFMTWTSDPGSPGAHWTWCVTDTIFVATDAVVTATPSYAWFRVEKQ